MKRKIIFVALVLAASVFAGCRPLSNNTDSRNGTNSAVKDGSRSDGGSAANESNRTDDYGANRRETDKPGITPPDENIRTDDKIANSGGEVLPISWTFSPGQFRGKNNRQFTFKCLPNGETAILYGTDVYTDDSSVCTAAVHAGVITIASGGTVTIEIRPGQNAYVGSERNGVKSSDFNNSWGGSFVFVPRTGGS